MNYRTVSIKPFSVIGQRP